MIAMLTTCVFAASTAYAAGPQTGSINIHKYEAPESTASAAAPGSGTTADVSKLPPEAKPLAGVKFTVRKVISDPTPATTSDVIFTYRGESFVADSSGAYTPHTIATNGAGDALFSALPLGYYLVSEQGPAAPFLVAIPTPVGDANGTMLYDIHAYPKTYVAPPENPEDPYIPEPPDYENPVTESPARPASTPSSIGSGDTPFAGLGSAAWSLLSLIMSVIAIVISLLLIIARIVRRRREDEDEDEREYRRAQRYEQYGDYDEEEDEGRNAYIARTLTVIFGILTPIVFLILDDLRLPMTWINRWTPYVALAFIIHIVFLIVYKLRNKERKEEDREQQQAS
jgi:uncharacterized membrane protein